MKFKMSSSERMDRRHILLSVNDKNLIERILMDYLGILGLAKCSPVFAESKNGVVLSINRKEIDNVRAAFEFCKEEVEILKVSGTLKGLGK